MAYNRKCVICNEPIVDEDGVPYKGRYAHQKCFNILVKTLHSEKSKNLDKSTVKKRTTKPRAELKEALSEEEYYDKKGYYEYLKTLLNTTEINPKIYVVSEEYIKRYNFTYKSMHSVLVYLNEIIEKELVGDIVGIIPYYYSEAMSYFETVEKVKESNKNIAVEQMYNKRKIAMRKRPKKIKQLDIDSIGKGEGV